jgi:hypothetical protein
LSAALSGTLVSDKKSANQRNLPGAWFSTYSVIRAPSIIPQLEAAGNRARRSLQIETEQQQKLTDRTGRDE